MRLVVGTSYDDQLPEKIHNYPVKYMYGSQTVSLTGHARRHMPYIGLMMKE